MRMFVGWLEVMFCDCWMFCLWLWIEDVVLLWLLWLWFCERWLVVIEFVYVVGGYWWWLFCLLICSCMRVMFIWFLMSMDWSCILCLIVLGRIMMVGRLLGSLFERLVGGIRCGILFMIMMCNLLIFVIMRIISFRWFCCFVFILLWMICFMMMSLLISLFGWWVVWWWFVFGGWIWLRMGSLFEEFWILEVFI